MIKKKIIISPKNAGKELEDAGSLLGVPHLGAISS